MFSGTVNQTAPDMPQFMATTLNAANFPDLFSSPVIKTVKASGGDFTSLSAALSNANISSYALNCGAIIIVDSGYTSDALGNNQNLNYNYSCPAGKHIWVRPSNYASLPPQNTRVGVADKTNMFTVSKFANSNIFDAGIIVADGATGLIISGMYFPVSGTLVYSAMEAGSCSNSSNYCSRILIDRSYFDTATSDYSTHFINPIFACCTTMAVVDSVIDHVNAIHGGSATESHGFVAINVPGPTKFVNNYVGGAPSESAFWGGAGEAGVGVTQTDVECRRNTFVKDVTQMIDKVSQIRMISGGTGYSNSFTVTATGCSGSGFSGTATASGGAVQGITINTPGSGYTCQPTFDFSAGGGSGASGLPIMTGPMIIKNLLECKSCTRALFDGNTAQFSQPDPLSGSEQNGPGFDITVSGSNGAYWTDLRDITFTNNDWQHINLTLAITAYDVNGVPSMTFPVTKRVVSRNNLWRDVNNYQWGWAAAYGTQLNSGNNYLWQPSHVFNTNNHIADSNGNEQTVTAGGGGSSGATQPVWNKTLNGTTTDGALTWTNNGAAPGVADQTILPGAYNITIDHDAVYGAPNNHASFMFVAGQPGCTEASFNNFTFTNTISVTDVNHLDGNCNTGGHTSNLFDGTFPSTQGTAGGAFPNLTVGGNILFNHETSGGNVCSHWATYNPGICPPGLASAPTTINSTLGMADYAACAAGNSNISLSGAGSGDLSKCVITGQYAGTGPNIAAIQAAQIEPNDSLKWGPRRAIL